MLEGLLDHPERLMLGQLVLLPILTLLAARFLRTAPARTHAAIVAGLFATLAAPVMFTLFRVAGFGVLPSLDLVISSVNTTSANSVNESARATSFFTLPMVAMIIWCAVSSFLFIRLFIGYHRGLAVSRAALPLDNAALQALLEPLAATQRRPVQLCSCASIASPAISCWSRQPRILLPRTMIAGTISGTPCNIDADTLAPILRHELAHLERRDHLWRLLAEVMLCLLPWHPAIWRLRHHLYDSSELACDARVVRGTVARAAYAESLLRLVPNRYDRLPALSGLRSTGCLNRRIRAILADQPLEDRTGRGWLVAMTIGAIALATTTALAQRRPFTFTTNDAVVVSPDQQPVGVVRAIPGELDLGLVAPGKSGEGTLRLVNAGNAPVTLTHSKAACGCTTIEPFVSRTLAAGEVITLDIRVDAPDTYDTERARTVTFFFDELEPLVVTVRLMTTAN